MFNTKEKYLTTQKRRTIKTTNIIKNNKDATILDFLQDQEQQQQAVIELNQADNGKKKIHNMHKQRKPNM